MHATPWPGRLARLVGRPLIRLQMRHGLVQTALLSLLPRRRGGCAGHVLPRLTIHLQTALQGRCIPLQSEGGRAMPVLMRACVHAEMRIGTRGRAECRCASTALLVGKRGLAAEAQALVHSRPPRAMSVAGAKLPASAAVISRWMWKLEKVSFLPYRRVSGFGLRV